MNRKGILVVVSGFSGVGKGTLMKCLTQRYGSYALSISATTRKPREGEEDGREYFFRTREEFEKLILEDKLLEYASYCDNYYGTPRDYVEDQLEQGRDVILEIEYQGALMIRKRFPDALLLFVMPPDIDTLLMRLHGRGTEQAEGIEDRLKRAREEAVGIENYDYMIVNDDLERSVEEMHRLIDCQHDQISRNLDFISRIRRDLSRVVEQLPGADAIG